MTTHLREELAALAQTQSFYADPAAWDRGRRVRRRDRVVRVVAVVAVVGLVAGVGALAVRPDAVAPVGDVRGGAIPSRIDLLGGDFEDDFAIGRASVALGGNGLELIDAEDGRHHVFGVVADLVALSPDGYRVAWWSKGALHPDRISLADLRTGEVREWAHNLGSSARVASMSWYPDSVQLLWRGRDDAGDPRAALIDVPGSSETPDISGRYGSRGIPSPSGDIVALASDGEVTSAPFEMAPTRESGPGVGIPIARALPTDLYPDGAVVTPIGWADEDHVVAIVDPPPSDVVERPRLVVFTRPELPRLEWTFREFLPRLPPEATSFAVDLIPDLTGDPDQELTHDFAAAQPDPKSDGGDRAPLVAGGLLALLAGIAFIRMMQQRA